MILYDQILLALLPVLKRHISHRVTMMQYLKHQVRNPLHICMNSQASYMGLNGNFVENNKNI
jgi:hypothetical protein